MNNGLIGFDNRLPSTYKYDDGYEDSSAYTKKWFIDWINGFNETAEQMMCIF